MPSQRTAKVSKGVKDGVKLAVLIIVVLTPWMISPQTSAYVNISSLTAMFGGGDAKKASGAGTGSAGALDDVTSTKGEVSHDPLLSPANRIQPLFVYRPLSVGRKQNTGSAATFRSKHDVYSWLSAWQVSFSRDHLI